MQEGSEGLRRRGGPVQEAPVSEAMQRKLQLHENLQVQIWFALSCAVSVPSGVLGSFVSMVNAASHCDCCQLGMYRLAQRQQQHMHAPSCEKCCWTM